MGQYNLGYSKFTKRSMAISDDSIMAELVPFLNPRLVGKRFDEHSIPLEVLKDFAALEELIVEVAKWHFKNDNPDRKRAPRGFADQITLKVSGIEAGSAIPNIVLSIAAAATTTLFPVDHRDYFEKAREIPLSLGK